MWYGLGAFIALADPSDENIATEEIVKHGSSAAVVAASSVLPALSGRSPACLLR
jgi:hypothetical protein